MKNILVISLLFLLAACYKKEEQAKVRLDENNSSQQVDGLHLSNQQVQLGHIITESLSEHEMGDEIILTGSLKVDQNKTSSISSRVMGRIEKLYFKNTGEKLNHYGLKVHRFVSRLKVRSCRTINPQR